MRICIYRTLDTPHMLLATAAHFSALHNAFERTNGSVRSALAAPISSAHPWMFWTKLRRLLLKSRSFFRDKVRGCNVTHHSRKTRRAHTDIDQ